MYKNAKTLVKTKNGESMQFDVDVGVHQGSVLSPLLFILVLDVIAKDLGRGLPWEMLIADDLVILGDHLKTINDEVMV